jgi:hypothetical protein
MVQGRAQRIYEVWERVDRSVAVGSISVGAALLLWHLDWSFPFFLVTYGLGLEVRRLVLWRYVVAAAVVVFALGSALVFLGVGHDTRDGLLWSTVGFWAGGWWKGRLTEGTRSTG